MVQFFFFFSYGNFKNMWPRNSLPHVEVCLRHLKEDITTKPYLCSCWSWAVPWYPRLFTLSTRNLPKVTLSNFSLLLAWVIVSATLLFLHVCFLCMFLTFCLMHHVYQTLRLEMRQQVQTSGAPAQQHQQLRHQHFLFLSLILLFYFVLLVISACDTPVETNQILHNEAVSRC